MNDNVSHLSLCAGIGGIDLGLRRVVRNLNTVAMVEREAFAISNLVQKMEEGELDSCPVYADLLRFPWQRFRGRVDIVSGGFPCTPFSVAGSRKATEDERHLWPHIRSGVAVLQPRVCFFENVDGIVTSPSEGYHSVLHHVLSDLEEMGFRTTAGQFSAEEVGAPQIRKRWFILAVAHRDIEGLERWNEPVDESSDQWPVGPGCPQRSDEPPRTIESDLGGRVDGIPNRMDRLRALGNAVVPAVAAKAFSTLWWRLHEQTT